MRKKQKPFFRIENLEIRQLLSTIYVDAAAPGSNTGSSWSNAYTDLQQALTTAASGTTIEVAQGVYKPSRSYPIYGVTFELKNDVIIYGGYAGYGEINPDARNVAAYPTILSGDIGQAGDNSDDIPNVVTAINLNSSTILDGFTITAGNADNAFKNYTFAAGGGLLSENSSLTLRNCTFSENSGLFCAGLYVSGGSPALLNCTFRENDGTAMRTASSSPTLVGCTFINNTAIDGAGMMNGDSSPILTNCTFVGNIASNASAYFSAPYSVPIGGAIENYNKSSPVLNNCVFIGNQALGSKSGNAVGSGGAIYNDSSIPILNNCTFADNEAVDGGAIGNISENNSPPCKPILNNCILSGDSATNSGNEIYNLQSTIPPSSSVVTYSDVTGGYTGTGNINADPEFIRPPSPGPDGAWGTADDDYGDLHLQPTSPCIDAGSNAAVSSGVVTDIAGNSRFVNTPGVHDPGAIVDMGAYEFGTPISITASALAPSQLSFSFSTDVSPSLVTSDLQLLSIGTTTPTLPAAVTYDASTNTADFDLSNLSPGIYTATINPPAISDAYGNILSAGYSANILVVGNNQTLTLPGTNQNFTIDQFALGTNSSVDLGSDTLAVQYAPGSDPVSSIASSIDSAYATGSWTGHGITSSDPLGQPANLTGVGYYDDGSQVKIRRSWFGDANLDGQIDADDLSLIALGQQEHTSRWQDGNFNYDTKVNADDWMILALAAGYSKGQVLAGSGLGSDTVPQQSAALADSSKASANNPTIQLFAQVPIANEKNLIDQIDSPQPILQ